MRPLLARCLAFLIWLFTPPRDVPGRVARAPPPQTALGPGLRGGHLSMEKGVAVNRGILELLGCYLNLF